jgi:hypothetical protein
LSKILKYNRMNPYLSFRVCLKLHYLPSIDKFNFIHRYIPPEAHTVFAVATCLPVAVLILLVFAASRCSQFLHYRVKPFTRFSSFDENTQSSCLKLNFLTFA